MKVPVSIRLDGELLAQIKQRATSRHTTVSFELHRAIREGLYATGLHDSAPPPDTKPSP